MRPSVRLACSPVRANAYLGPFRTHLLNYAIGAQLRLSGGAIYIRCDDTNPNKGNRQEFDDFAEFCERTFGMRFDQDPDSENTRVYQSERTGIYDTEFEKLCDLGFVVTDPNSNAAFFNLEKFVSQTSEEQKAKDLIRGDIRLDYATLITTGRGLFPIKRADGQYLYHFTAPVDDMSLGVTHVGRGADKMNALPYHEAIRTALSHPQATYIHFPLLLNEAGGLLKGAGTYIPDLIESGIQPMAIAAYLFSSCGFSDVGNISNLDRDCAGLNLSRISKTNGKFSLAKLQCFNRSALKDLEDTDYQEGVLNYIARISNGSLRESIKASDVPKSIVRVRRDFTDAARVMMPLISPRYEVRPSPAVMSQVADTIGKCTEMGGLKDLFLTDASFKATRWILTGEENGLEIDEIVSYLDSRGLLGQRLILSKQALAANEFPK